VENNTGDVIAYINSTGYGFLKGILTEGAVMTTTTKTNLEIRNASDSMVAFFDNEGNLSLQGSLYENHTNP